MAQLIYKGKSTIIDAGITAIGTAEIEAKSATDKRITITLDSLDFLFDKDNVSICIVVNGSTLGYWR